MTQGVVLLDGGMGQELIARSRGAPTPLWSADAMDAEPETVAAIHRDFAEAGATVLTLNTYSATPERLAKYVPATEVEPRFAHLQGLAAGIGTRVADAAGQAVAGCLPPLGGSYHPHHAPEPEAMDALYRRLAAVQAPSCDLFLAETMASVREARAATRAIRAADRPAWIALTVDDDDGRRLRGGEPLDEACAAVVRAGADAILLNCSRPEAIAQGLDVIAGAGLPFGAYANGFTSVSALSLGGTVDALSARRDLAPDAYAAHAMDWIDRGATIVGGCCEVGPPHIARLARAIRESGRTLATPPRLRSGQPASPMAFSS